MQLGEIFQFQYCPSGWLAKTQQKILALHQAPPCNRVMAARKGDCKGAAAARANHAMQRVAASCYGKKVWRCDAGVIKDALGLSGLERYHHPITTMRSVNRCPYRISTTKAILLQLYGASAHLLLAVLSHAFVHAGTQWSVISVHPSLSVRVPTADRSPLSCKPTLVMQACTPVSCLFG